MPEIKATLSLEIDGVTLPDFPVVRRIVFAEGGLPALQIIPSDANTSTYHQVPSITSPDVTVIYASTDQNLNLNLNQFTNLPLTAGGFILIFGTQLQQGTPANDLTINNPPVASGGSGASANVTVLNAGS